MERNENNNSGEIALLAESLSSLNRIFVYDGAQAPRGRSRAGAVEVLDFGGPSHASEGPSQGGAQSFRALLFGTRNGRNSHSEDFDELGPLAARWGERNGSLPNGVLSKSRPCARSSLNPVVLCCRSEEPVHSSMDISTGHLILVRLLLDKFFVKLFQVCRLPFLLFSVCGSFLAFFSIF